MVLQIYGTAQPQLVLILYFYSRVQLQAILRWHNSQDLSLKRETGFYQSTIVQHPQHLAVTVTTDHLDIQGHGDTVTISRHEHRHAKCQKPWGPFKNYVILLGGGGEVTKRLHKITMGMGGYTKRLHWITRVKLAQPQHRQSIKENPDNTNEYQFFELKFKQKNFLL